MTTDTPVRAWDYPYPVGSLPNGMPLPRSETTIGAAGVRVLASRDDAALWGGEFVSVSADPTPAGERQQSGPVVLFEHTVLPTQIPSGRFTITGQAGPVTVRILRDADARALGDLVEGARRLLGLEVEEVSALLGVRRRTFYDLVKVREPASARPGVGDRARILMALAEIDPGATAALVRRDPSRAADLLASGAFIALRESLQALRGERFALAAAQAPIRSLGDISGEVLAAIRDLASRASLKSVMAGIQAIAPDFAPGRLVAAADVTRNVEAAHDGDDVDAEWSFLVTLRHEEMDALGDRALAVIRSAGFSAERWRQFVDQESGAARATAGFVPLAPDVDEPASPGGEAWAPDIAAFGASLRFSDYNRGA